MNRSTRNRWLRGFALATLAIALSACETQPRVRTETAPSADITRYQTFAFVEHPDTDKPGYTTITTRFLKDAVTREMLARGYTQSEKPDLLVNFTIGTKDKVEGYGGPGVGVGYGRWGRGFGYDLGYWGHDIRTVTEGSLTIDVVDHSRSELVWRGTAAGELTRKNLDHPQPAIDSAVSAIFAKYPKPPLVAQASPVH